jgi:hypothetical protein
MRQVEWLAVEATAMAACLLCDALVTSSCRARHVLWHLELTPNPMTAALEGLFK